MIHFGPEGAPAAAQAFSRDGRVRIADFLDENSAGDLHRFLDRDAQWWRVLNMGEKSWDLGPESIAALTGTKEQELLRAVHAQARDGFQYMYDSLRVSDEPEERRQRGLPVDRLLDAMNSEAMLAIFRTLTGDARIARVDGQATRYLPGHFLTAHDDAVAGRNRVAAYVLGLTPRWRTEWGGLLQFHDGQGDIEQAFAPRFNTLNLFRVPQFHSVSLVAPFAAVPRISVTGWLRYDSESE